MPNKTTGLALTCAITALLASGCTTPSEPVAGNELYAANCSICHGLYGDGSGPAAAAIPQTVPDLRQIAALNGGEFPRDLVRKIIDGREIIDAHRSDVMPRWGTEFELSEGYTPGASRRVDAKIDALVDYLAGIQLDD